MNYTQEQLKMRDLIHKTAREANISPVMEKIGTAVLWAESGLNPSAVCKNRFSSDFGIAQFNDYWYWKADKIISPADALIPEKALPVFWKYFPKRSNNWIAYKNGSWRKFYEKV